MGKPCIDHFHPILSSMPIQELSALANEYRRLHAEGMSMHDIAWRFAGALTYVYDCRVEGRDPETGRRVGDDFQQGFSGK